MLKLFILFLLIIIDIVSKQWIYNSIDLNRFIPVFTFLDITHIHNYGISFGLFSGLFSSWVFVIISFCICILLLYLYFQSKNLFEKWAFLFVISGALSNIIDRIINGFVIDFIYLHYRDFYWPAFNFADICISIGIFIIITLFFRELLKKSKGLKD